MGEQEARHERNPKREWVEQISYTAANAGRWVRTGRLEVMYELSDPVGTIHVREAIATGCSGDPTDLDGGSHPWVLISEDNQGMHYTCPHCGAKDTD